MSSPEVYSCVDLAVLSGDSPNVGSLSRFLPPRPPPIPPFLSDPADQIPGNAEGLQEQPDDVRATLKNISELQYFVEVFRALTDSLESSLKQLAYMSLMCGAPGCIIEKYNDLGMPGPDREEHISFLSLQRLAVEDKLKDVVFNDLSTRYEEYLRMAYCQADFLRTLLEFNGTVALSPVLFQNHYIYGPDGSISGLNLPILNNNLTELKFGFDRVIEANQTMKTHFESTLTHRRKLFWHLSQGVSPALIVLKASVCIVALASIVLYFMKKSSTAYSILMTVVICCLFGLCSGIFSYIRSVRRRVVIQTGRYHKWSDKIRKFNGPVQKRIAKAREKLEFLQGLKHAADRQLERLQEINLNRELELERLKFEKDIAVINTKRMEDLQSAAEAAELLLLKQSEEARQKDICLREAGPVDEEELRLLHEEIVATNKLYCHLRETRLKMGELLKTLQGLSYNAIKEYKTLQNYKKLAVMEESMCAQIARSKEAEMGICLQRLKDAGEEFEPRLMPLVYQPVLYERPSNASKILRPRELVASNPNDQVLNELHYLMPYKSLKVGEVSAKILVFKESSSSVGNTILKLSDDNYYALLNGRRALIEVVIMVFLISTIFGFTCKGIYDAIEEYLSQRL